MHTCMRSMYSVLYFRQLRKALNIVFDNRKSMVLISVSARDKSATISSVHLTTVRKDPAFEKLVSGFPFWKYVSSETLWQFYETCTSLRRQVELPLSSPSL